MEERLTYLEIALRLQSIGNVEDLIAAAKAIEAYVDVPPSVEDVAFAKCTHEYRGMMRPMSDVDA